VLLIRFLPVNFCLSCEHGYALGFFWRARQVSRFSKSVYFPGDLRAAEILKAARITASHRQERETGLNFLKPSSCSSLLVTPPQQQQAPQSALQSSPTSHNEPTTVLSLSQLGKLCETSQAQAYQLLAAHRSAQTPC
jgi:hypothetical protein